MNIKKKQDISQKRVMHIISGLATGGAEMMLYKLLYSHLHNPGNVLVVSLGNEGNLGIKIQELGIPVECLGIRASIPAPSALFKLRRVVNNFRPDIIQGWMYHGNLAGWIASIITKNSPVLIWNLRQSLYELANEKPLTRFVIRVNRYLSRRADAIIYNSFKSCQQHNSFGFSPQYVKIIPNGFDTRQFKPDPETGHQQREQLGIPEQSIVIGHIARFHPMKDHTRYLRVAVDITRKRDDVCFLLIGRNVNADNPAFSGIIPAKFANRFIFLDERDDIFMLMQVMDMFCLSSAWGEAFPNVVGEAMASGLPCVATDVGDCAEILGDTGIVVSPKDDMALFRGLMTILTMPGSVRHDLGWKARKRIENKYALQNVVEQYATLYESITPTEDSAN